MEDSANIRTWKEARVGYVQLNRPEKANAYDQLLLDALRNALDEMEADGEVRVLVIRGAGDRSFCAGADLNEMSVKGYRFALDLESAKVFDELARCRKVTMAAINGAAVAGGLELALACDLRIASDSARFFFPEPKRGLIPAAGGTRRLPELVGVARAKELILGGREWCAEDALRYGRVSEVLEPDELMRRAQEWGETISGMDPLALELAKKAIDSESGFELAAEALLYELRLARQAEAKTTGSSL